MDIHKNARLTVHGRERIVRQVMSGQTPKAAALAVGVCPRTIRKWVARYRAEGLSGLRDRSSRPRRLRRPTPQEIVRKVEQLRRQRWTGKQIAAEVGARASRRYLEFFAVTIENPNTRAAYLHACRRFFAWCEQKNLDEIVAIEPMHVAAYIRALGKDFEKPTVKQHLAAIRMLFDWLVVGQVVTINPAHTVRGPKHAIKRGKTPVLTPDEARKLLDSIDVTTVVGLRDRALIGIMAYSFARVSAAVVMRVEDYYATGKRWWVRLHEKGGKRHEMPCHHNLEAYLDAYLQAAKILEAKKSPLFRSARGRTGELTESPMSRIDVWRMIRRRAIGAGLSADICCHTFRATGITAYLENGGTLENAQLMAAHESPRTTKLYDRTGDEITLDEVERIVI